MEVTDTTKRRGVNIICILGRDPNKVPNECRQVTGFQAKLARLPGWGLSKITNLWRTVTVLTLDNAKPVYESE
jgi:hypothetical protein